MTSPKQSGSKALELPGLGLPVDFMPGDEKHFPVLVGLDTDSHEVYKFQAATLLTREACMLKVMDDLTDKPEWWRKVNDGAIVSKWKTEALSMDWDAYRPYADFTPRMFDACIEELRTKAALYEETGLIPTFDYSMTAIKSDKLMTESLRQDLLSAVKVLEDVPEAEKDWHPGSDNKVLDLVHPSLCPLVYGKTRVLQDRRVGVDNCIETCGLGDVIIPSSTTRAKNNTLSRRFQWLPSDVEIDDTGHARIDSYINNLHPTLHATLYPVIEKFINVALPAWDLIYRWPEEFEFQRLETLNVYLDCKTPEVCGQYGSGCHPWNRPADQGERALSTEEVQDFDHGDYDDPERRKKDREWFARTHPLPIPDATLEKDRPENCEKKFFNVKPEDVCSSNFFGKEGKQRIQVITKLANIHLTPEKPEYEGGSWHIEGQINEHICATALFYYDNENITDSRLSFRTSGDREDLMMELHYEQDDHESIERAFYLTSDRGSLSTTQNVGSVLTRAGRAVFFPNTYQHRVQPFSLADRSKPGHRKILALFLVDPAIPIVSTANVPPQQRHWWTDEDTLRQSNRLPPEIVEMILANIDSLFSKEEAKDIRAELMEERSSLQHEATKELEVDEFNFCEH